MDINQMSQPIFQKNTEGHIRPTPPGLTINCVIEITPARNLHTDIFLKTKIWETSGEHLGGHLADIWEHPEHSQMLQEAPGYSRRARKQQSMPLSARMTKSCLKLFVSIVIPRVRSQAL